MTLTNYVLFFCLSLFYFNLFHADNEFLFLSLFFGALNLFHCWMLPHAGLTYMRE